MILHHHYYINLDHRTDRKHETIRELSNIGLYQPNRYNAIKHRMGIAGCGMSHIGVLETAKERGVPYVTIFEDDVMFLNPRETLTKLDRIINSKIEWDVILLGGNNFKPYDTLNDDCIRVYNCQTTTAYIVKQSYYDTLINHWKQGLQKLIQTGDVEKYALDQYWKNLQKRDMYLLLTPLNVVQRESYSDIEHQSVNYVSAMKNVN
jgi:GR25 family glycosyltransferase involved in LPS biosynthesis